MNLEKGVFYLGQDQFFHMDGAIRKHGWEVPRLIGELKHAESTSLKLLETDENSPTSLIKTKCREILIILQLIVQYLNSKNVKSPIGIDEYNGLYFKKDANVTHLFTQVRNGLVHYIQGDGLSHKATKIKNNHAVPFYFIIGKEMLWNYPSKYSSEELSKDFRFGCGYYRISILLHVLPFIQFAFAELEKLHVQQDTPVNIHGVIEVLPVR